MTTAEDIYSALRLLSDEEKREVLPRFFKTGKGEYGEGDKFIGVIVPNVIKVAKECRDASMEVIGELLNSPWHEMRLCALFVMVERCKKEVPEEIYKFYLAHTSRINNWDLVDLSSPTVVGGYLMNRPRDPLFALADSQMLWDNRIAIVSTLKFIRNGDLDTTYELSLKMMRHSHDLMHKAIGWMLREAGKKDHDRLYRFVDDYRREMPRTMLRYAIEKFDNDTRQYLMRKE